MLNDLPDVRLPIFTSDTHSGDMPAISSSLYSQTKNHSLQVVSEMCVQYHHGAMESIVPQKCFCLEEDRG